MAWSPSPEVAVARDAANKLKGQQCVIIWLDHERGRIGMASYGQTKALCREAKGLGERLYAEARKWIKEADDAE